MTAALRPLDPRDSARVDPRAPAPRPPSHRGPAHGRLASDFTRRLVWTLIPPQQLGAPPLRGLARLAGHLEHAFYRAWPFCVAAAAVAVLARRRPHLLAIPYIAAVACLVVTYPAIRGDALRRFYLAADLAATLVGVASGAPGDTASTSHVVGFGRS